ncbi:MAG TPA: hypothetical protein VGJ75_20135, partial [Dongiaceae bacterium]
MTKPTPSRRARILRRLFRWGRITVLLLVLATLMAGLFLNKVGLPEFLKRRLVAQMRARGWEVEFSRMRLRWYRGIVAEDLQLRRTNSMVGPHLFIDVAEFRLNREALRDFDLHADAVTVHGAR